MTLQLSNRAQPRFSNDFLVAPVPNGQATQDEAEFMRALDATVTPNDPYEGVLTKIARLNAEDAAQPDGALKTELQRALQEAVSGMRAVAQRVTDGRSPRLGVADLFVWEGRCSQQREQLSSSRFVVTSDVSPQTGLVQDVNVWVNPNPIEAVTPAQQDLFVAMGETSSIVRIVCDGWDKKERRRRFLAAGHRSRAEGIQHEYLSNVSSIGGFGLFGSQVDFATKALAWLQSDFAAMAAPRVKILYLASLARWCGPAFLILFGCYLLVGFDPGRGLDPSGVVPFVFSSDFVKSHKAFFLLTAGASLGVWLSFAARDVAIPFKSLATPEADLLSARQRLAFVLGLSVLAALLFWTHALNIEIGNLKTLKFEGATAFLIGGFFGLAERALSDSVVKRAASFVSALGGG